MSKATLKKNSQTKTDFIAQIAQKVEISKKESERLVNTILETLQETMAKGIDQSFIGFGTFATKDRPEKTARNPLTGKPVVVKAKRVPVFKAGTQLKAAVDQGKK